jgi:hypothetical protein
MSQFEWSVEKKLGGNPRPYGWSFRHAVAQKVLTSDFVFETFDEAHERAQRAHNRKSPTS